MRRVSPEEVKEAAKEELLRKRGVVGISFKHHSPKIIRLYVERLEPRVMKEIPKMLLGYKVEVIEVGKVKPLLSPEEKQRKWRVLVPGISIGSCRVTAGTLGQIAIDNTDGEYVLLSNYHVFYGSEGDPIYAPGSYDGGTSEDTVGCLKRYVEVRADYYNLVDAAIASIKEGVEFSNDSPELGSPATVRDPVEGETVAKSGRTTCLTYAKVIDPSATIKVYDYPGVGDVWFDDVIVTECFAAGGDSGSPTIAVSDGALVGLVFAGSSKITCLIKATNIVRMLDITIITGTPKVGVVRAGLVPLLGLFAFPFLPEAFKRVKVPLR